MPSSCLQGPAGATGPARINPEAFCPAPLLGCCWGVTVTQPGRDRAPSQRREEGWETHTKKYTQNLFLVVSEPARGSGRRRDYTLGAANTFQPSSWPILTSAAIVPMYAQAAAPIP